MIDTVVPPINCPFKVQSDTGAPPDSSRVEEVVEDGAGSYSGGAPQLGMDWAPSPIWEKFNMSVEFTMSLVDCFKFFVQ